MLYSKMKKEALATHKQAADEYDEAYKRMEQAGTSLYDKRQNSLTVIREVELLINSIANCPKEFDTKISHIQVERAKFQKTVDYATEAMKSTVKSGGSVAAGIAAGGAIASVAPTAAMWVATTFGTASTGTAISTLSGAVATKAALAWLGGGALSAGGAGIAGGQALLALAGPIGWGIAGGTTVISAVSLGHKNKKIADKAISEVKNIAIAKAELEETRIKIQYLTEETKKLLFALRDTTAASQFLRGANYLELSESEQYHLGSIVNNTSSLAVLLNKTV